jgi:hypothetical protein
MGVTKHFIGSSLLNEDELSKLLTTEITYSSVNKLPEVKFFRFFNKPFQTEASFLNLCFINNLLKTFPPVWNCSLNGFDIRYENGYQVYMIVNHEKGQLSYFLGEITFEETEDFVSIKEKQ